MPQPGFDYNQWQAMNQQQSAGPGEAATLDSLSQDGVDKAVQTVFKFLGWNSDIKGHGVLPGETHVGSGLSLQHGAMVKEKPGGVLATLFKYFTRDIPNLFAGPDSGGGDAPASYGNGGSSDGGDFSGSSVGALTSGDSPSMGGGGSSLISERPEIRDYGGKMMASNPMEISLSSLGTLTPSSTPNEGRNGLDVGASASV